MKSTVPTLALPTATGAAAKDGKESSALAAQSQQDKEEKGSVG